MQKITRTVVVGVLLLTGVFSLLLIQGKITPEENLENSNIEIPATGGDFSSLEPMIAFIKLVFNGERNTIRGVYSPGVMSYPVIRQPPGNPALVSEEPDIVTQFQLADTYNVIGLLAHNYLAGDSFFKLQIGDSVWVIYGDGSARRYEVVAIKEYYVKEPYNVYSQFIDLDSGLELSVNEMFMHVYSGDHHLTLQVSVSQGNDEAWGRRFIIAEPRESQTGR
jgi:hypothetical protein